MKKVSLVALLGLSLAFLSCESDDDATFVPKNYLAGKWTPVEIGHLNANNTITYSANETNENCESDAIIFGEDFTYTNNDFEFNGSTCDAYTENGTYQFINGVIVAKHQEEIDGTPTEVTTSYRVLSLTYDAMEISFTDAETHEMVFVKLKR